MNVVELYIDRSGCLQIYIIVSIIMYVPLAIGVVLCGFYCACGILGFSTRKREVSA
jgi:hypothetical protein